MPITRVVIASSGVWGYQGEDRAYSSIRRAYAFVLGDARRRWGFRGDEIMGEAIRLVRAEMRERVL